MTKFKRISTFALTAALLLSMTSCGKKQDESSQVLESIEAHPEIMTSKDGTKTVKANTAVLEYDGKHYDCSVKWNIASNGYYEVSVKMIDEGIVIPQYDFDSYTETEETIDEIIFTIPQDNINEGQIYNAGDLAFVYMTEQQILTLYRDVPDTVLDVRMYVNPEYDVALEIDTYKPTDTLIFSLDYTGFTSMFKFTEDGEILQENNRAVYDYKYWTFKLFGGAYFGEDNSDQAATSTN